MVEPWSAYDKYFPILGFVTEAEPLNLKKFMYIHRVTTKDPCGVVGIPLVENKNKIQLFKVFDWIRNYISISCFLKDVDPICKSLKNVLNG